MHVRARECQILVGPSFGHCVNTHALTGHVVDAQAAGVPMKVYLEILTADPFWMILFETMRVSF